jgi:NNP family nitrate/nitrite transporter-like MFS transporter
MDLTKQQVWVSSILAVTSSAVTRVWIGPINDKYGARHVMSGTLVAAAVPTLLAPFVVHNAAVLYVIRLCIGVAGSSFVTCVFWTSSMFAVEVVGTANSLAAGWGNVGGAAAQLVMGSVLFPLLKMMFRAILISSTGSSSSIDQALMNNGTNSTTNDYNNSTNTAAMQADDRAADWAWRTSLVFPALLSLVMAWFILGHSDDTPKGNRRRDELIDSVSAIHSLKQGVSNLNTWILLLQYGYVLLLCFCKKCNIRSLTCANIFVSYLLTLLTAAALESKLRFFKPRVCISRMSLASPRKVRRHSRVSSVG